ncbi:MAG: hypothetical protein Q4B70_10560, partial [Lachnospiraceae bacterium]|nr:hypothetical protein [Lachnospiraceae bacterium]
AHCNGKYVFKYVSISNGLALYSYNCKTGKKRKIASSISTSQLVGKRIYYAVSNGNGTYNIYNVNLAGGNKKTIVKKLKAFSFGIFDSKYIYYNIYDSNTSATTYYRYNIKTKKSQKISESQYLSVWY